jgi:hypothetical protein
MTAIDTVRRAKDQPCCKDWCYAVSAANAGIRGIPSVSIISGPITSARGRILRAVR